MSKIISPFRDFRVNVGYASKLWLDSQIRSSLSLADWIWLTGEQWTLYSEVSELLMHELLYSSAQVQSMVQVRNTNGWNPEVLIWSVQLRVWWSCSTLLFKD